MANTSNCLSSRIKIPDELKYLLILPHILHCFRATRLIGDGTNRDEYAEVRSRVINNWHDLNVEDIDIIERMQAGRLSDGFDVGVLSPYWGPAQQRFARLISNSVRENVGP